jgi:hypothetical protein
MKFFGAVIIFLIAFFAVVLLIVFFFIRKLVIRFRQHLTGDYDEETFKRMADKHYRGDGRGPQFEKDYFKGTGTSRNGSGYTKQQRQEHQHNQTQCHTTTTDEGVTIIDNRQPNKTDRKIFTHDEGEYVEFTEE